MRRTTVARAAAAAAVVTAISSAPAAWAGGGGGCTESTEGSGSAVEMEHGCFTPNVLRVDEGATVTFVNGDEMVHVVMGIGWGSGELAPGSELAQRFDAAGTYAYSCYLHPSMNGAVVVGDGIGSGPVVEGSPPSSTTTLQATPTAGEDPGSSTDAPLVAGTGAGGAAVGFLAARAAARLRARSDVRRSVRA